MAESTVLAPSTVPAGEDLKRAEKFTLEPFVHQDEPKLVDGTVLSAHQVDALSGTLIALLAEAQNGNGSRNGSAPANVEELPSGEVELEGDDEIADDDEPLDWQDA